VFFDDLPFLAAVTFLAAAYTQISLEPQENTEDEAQVDIILNPLKTEFRLSEIYKFSSYLTGNTLRLHYKAQPVNAVWGISRCLL
jgi:hypothetical protein